MQVCPGGDLRLSEVAPADFELLPDEDGEYSGWIELENAGATPLDLHGCGLSIDRNRPLRWTFPALVLPAGERLVVFASGKDRCAVPSFRPGGGGSSTGPGVAAGLALWLDADDLATLGLSEGRVAEWRDKSGRQYVFADPAARSPDQVPGLALWLDASAEGSLGLEHGAVAAWRDRSGCGRDAVQVVPAARPRPELDVRGGPPCLRFDGEDDVLGLAATLKARTFFWVAAEDPTAPLGLSVVVGHRKEGPLERGQWGAIYRTRVAGIGLPAEYYTWVNGEPVNALGTPMPTQTAVVTTLAIQECSIDLIGSDRGRANGFWQGTIGEVVAFDRALTAEERDGVTSYLVQKWRPARAPRSGWRHATQAADERRPRLERDVVSRLPHVAFDGRDDFLEFPRISEIRTAFAVLREQVGTQHDDRPWLGDTVYADFARGDDGLVYSARLAWAAVGVNWLDGAPFDPTVTRLPQRWVVLATRPRLPVHANTLSFDRSVAGRVWCGDVGEVLLYDRALNDAEVGLVHAYLQDKWQLPPRALHTDFTLEGREGVLVLSRPDGTLLDEWRLPPVAAGVSVGRPPASGAGLRFFTRPSPGAPNLGPHFGGIAPALAATVPSGLCEAPMQVSVAAPGWTGDIYYTRDGSEPGAPLGSPLDLAWVDDFVPDGAVGTNGLGGPLQWVHSPTPQSGSHAVRTRLAPGEHGDAVRGLDPPRPVGSGDNLFVHVYPDPDHPPRQILLQWSAADGDRQAFWGADLVVSGTPAGRRRFAAGPLPPTGRWTRLEVPAGAVDLEDRAVSGFAVTLFDGRVWWDRVGRATRHPGTSRLFVGPLQLDSTTVVRWRAVGDDAVPGPVLTRSYLFHGSTGLPVISLASAPEGLFSELEGICTRGTNASPAPPYYGANFWRDWERPVVAEFFEPDGTGGFAIEAGLRIHGAWSRFAPQQAFELEARRRYGTGQLRYRVFPDVAIDEFDALVLRNFGNDWVASLIRDPLLQGLMAGTATDGQASRFAHLYLNGQYWGLYDLREKHDRTYLAAHHGPQAIPADILENDSGVRDGDGAAYQQLWSLVAASDCTRPAAGEAILAQIDADSFLDWELIEVFCDNRDWPFNNTKTWRPRRPDGRWRWMLTDLDAGFAVDGPGPAAKTLERAGRWVPGSRYNQFSVLLLSSLLQNSGFRQAFINRAADHLNSRFATDQVLARIDTVADRLAPELGRHIERWRHAKDPLWPPLKSLDQWRAKVEDLRRYARERPDRLRQHFLEFFQLGGTAQFEFAPGSPAGGHLLLNSLRLELAELPWSGVLFCGVPIRIEAVPCTGYRFGGWVGWPELSPRLDLVLDGSLRLAPVFELDPAYDPASLEPPAHDLRGGPYRFSEWNPAAAAGTYPANLRLLQSSRKDPRLEDPLDGTWCLPYQRTSRSRITGLGTAGLSFLNTSDPQPEQGAGYPAGALLALRTTGRTNVTVTWTGGTLAPNARTYALRLQYRLGQEGPFRDVRDAQGRLVEYERNEIVGHEAVLGPVTLGPRTADQPLVQLLWRYHWIPTGASGTRAHLRLDDIQVVAFEMPVAPVLLGATLAPDGTFRLDGRAPPGASVQLWTSSNLREWRTHQQLQADGAGVIEYTVAIASGITAAFYRLVVCP